MLMVAIIASVLLPAGIGGAVGYVIGHGRGVRSAMATDRRRIVRILQDLRDLATTEEGGDELAARRNRARGQGSFGPGGAP